LAILKANNNAKVKKTEAEALANAVKIKADGEANAIITVAKARR